MTQTLFGQSIAHSTSGPRQVPRTSSYYTQPCTTPTFSSSFTLASQFSEAQHQPQTTWALETASLGPRDDVDEDERMVEDLLVPRSPIAPTSIFHFSVTSSSVSNPHFIPSQMYETAPSSFTSTDPFYADMCAQAQRHDAPPLSAFTQLGCPAQQSPFALQASLQRREHPGPSRSAPPLSVDTHSFLVSTSIPFNH